MFEFEGSFCNSNELMITYKDAMQILSIYLEFYQIAIFDGYLGKQIFTTPTSTHALPDG
jgi:hypothetical protein